jgi:LacI family transcriptional regulator
LTRNILTSRIQPTAVICENWQVCRACLMAADELAMRIPDDISIVGYGQNVLEMSSTVGLTSYVPANAQVGTEAAETLVRLMRGEETSKAPVFFPGRLVIRNSVRSLR